MHHSVEAETWVVGDKVCGCYAFYERVETALVRHEVVFFAPLVECEVVPCDAKEEAGFFGAVRGFEIWFPVSFDYAIYGILGLCREGETNPTSTILPPASPYPFPASIPPMLHQLLYSYPASSLSK